MARWWLGMARQWMGLAWRMLWLGLGMGRLVESLVESLVVGPELELVGAACLLSGLHLSVGTSSLRSRREL